MFFLVLFLGCGVNNTNAQGTQAPAGEVKKYVPLSPLPNTVPKNCTGDACETDLSTYIPGLFMLAIGVAGVLAVIMIVIGGIQKMSTDSVFDQNEGKKKIKNAIGGLLLAIAAWLILNTINPRLLDISNLLPPVSSAKNPQQNP